MRGIMAAFCMMAGLTAFSTEACSQEAIVWSVQDRYRLFDQADTEAKGRIEALLTSLKALPGDKPETTLGRNGAAMLKTLSGVQAQSLRRSNWSPTERRYGPNYLYPDVYRIVVSLPGEPASAVCRWQVDQEAPLPPAPCGAPAPLALRATTEGPDQGARATVSVQVIGSGRLITQSIVIEDRLIVAVGDSFIAGEGNPDVPADFSALAPSAAQKTIRWPAGGEKTLDKVTIAQWWDEPCHRSLLSWPVLATLHQAAQDPHAAVTLVHLGCSGATTPEIWNKGQKDLPGCGEDVPKGERRTCPPESAAVAQLDALEAMLNRRAQPRRIDKLLMSSGGNDVGFAGVITYAVVPPNGYGLGPLTPAMMAHDLKPVCPYDKEGIRVLRRFCLKLLNNTPTAETRLRSLPANYRDASQAFGKLSLGRNDIYQLSYPNLLYDENGELCQHALLEIDIDEIPAWRPGLKRREEDYLGRHYDRRRPFGFEALQVLVPGWFDTGKRWSFQFAHPAGKTCPSPKTATDSEVCKALWVWTQLNAAIEDADDQQLWTVVKTHVERTKKHGWCVTSPGHPLALPLAMNAGGSGMIVWGRNDHPGPKVDQTGWPQIQDPYPLGDGRWFRTANDSFLTQYGGFGRIHQGTIHPTYAAHLAYAAALLESPYGKPAAADR
ncbi:MAG: hypothetical protein QM608_17240 [Caulobacter sp.]